MTTPLNQLAAEIIPSQTVLFFGSGSSVPSGAPSVSTLEDGFANQFTIAKKGFNLRELASLAEDKARGRKPMITELRRHFTNLSPTGGLLNLPLYNWKSIFTTNYDELIEASYIRSGVDITPFDSNFDFTMHGNPTAAKLFKIHGTINKDISDGHVSRIIITDSDYDHTQDYREKLFDRLKSDMAGSHVIIIGHSLSDEDVKAEIAHAISLNSQTQGAGRISLLLYNNDGDRATLYEKRGLQVCFGGIDEFFAELAKHQAAGQKTILSENPLDWIPQLRPVTTDVQHSVDLKNPDVSRMFNGWPANFAEIVAGFTFQRSLVDDLDVYLNSDSVLTGVIVGASGVGKTTATRQLAIRCLRQGKLCWEHKPDQLLSVEGWADMMHRLRAKGLEGVLFIDDAHAHLAQINDIIDRAVSSDNAHLKLVLASNRNQWYPRIKTPNLYKFGKEWLLSKLANEEIERLLQLIDTNAQIRNLVEPVFSGFSRQERRRRLVDRCEKDFFVCLRNIFATIESR